MKIFWDFEMFDFPAEKMEEESKKLLDEDRKRKTSEICGEFLQNFDFYGRKIEKIARNDEKSVKIEWKATPASNTAICHIDEMQSGEKMVGIVKTNVEIERLKFEKAIE